MSGVVCAALPTKPGGQCDEYPFASTRQGASFRVIGLNWTVRAINGSQNLSAGEYLGEWYKNQRMLPGDEFFVLV